MNAKNLLRLSLWIFTLCGVWLFMLGMYFIFIRTSLLPEDLRFLNLENEDVQKNLPRLSQWLHYVFTVMGGFIASCGILILFMATRILRHHFTGFIFALSITGLLTVGTMSWINFLIDSHFKWLLLMPAILWFIGIVSYGFSKKLPA
jgi:hypothetical protein